MNTFTTKKARSGGAQGGWGRRAMVVAAALFAAIPLQADAQGKSGNASQGQQWTYDVRTTGGHAQGRVYFKRTSGNCYQAGTDGYVDDTAADNTSVEIILEGKDCKTGREAPYNVARVGGAAKKPLYFNSGYKNGLKDVTVKLCRWKDGRGTFDCREPTGGRV
ncbi:MAG TPA: hypothetical protein VFK02_36935 [Kofleriaceae bacterium]|nr:hypothetical protein [Kofleriaceae bacterium]